jgi:phage-related protein
MEEIGIEISLFSENAEKKASNLSNAFSSLNTIVDKSKNFFKNVSSSISSIIPTQEKFISKLKENQEIIKQTSSSAIDFAKGILFANFATGLYNKAMGQMPEVNQAFSDIGNIIFSNFFKPLKDQVVPILQAVVGFVKKNKEIFVMFGNVVGNIFRAIVGVVKQLFDSVKKIIKNVFGVAGNDIKGAATKLSEFLNFIVLKISFILTFVMVLLEPVLEAIAKGIKYVFQEIAMPILNKFGEAISFVAQLFENPKKAIDEFGILVQMLATGGIALLTVGLVALGKIFLASLIPAIVSATTSIIAFSTALLANPITLIIASLVALVGAILLVYKNWDKIKNFFTSTINEIREYFNSLSNKIIEFVNNIFPINEAINSVKQVWQDLVSKFQEGINFISNLINNIVEKIFSLVDKFKSIGSLVGNLFSGNTNVNVENISNQKNVKNIQEKFSPSEKTNGEITRTSANVKQENNIDNKFTFNITGDNPQEIAKEVEKKIKSSNESLKKQFNKFAPAKGLL